MSALYWLSFCDASLPEGQQFLGVSIVDLTEADLERGSLMSGLLGLEAEVELVAAMSKAHRLGINPGGEVMVVKVPDEVAEVYRRMGVTGRLLSRGEAEAL